MNNKAVDQKNRKLRMDLIPPAAIQGMAKGFESGLVKHEERDWEKGYPYSMYYAAAMRHLTAWWGGEDNDPEDGVSHLDHLSSCVAILQHYVCRSELFQGQDDRPS